jgi:hypothetical protein
MIITRISRFTTRFLNKNLLLIAFAFLSSEAWADLTIVQNVEDFQSVPAVPAEHVKVYVSENKIRLDQGQKISSIILKDKKVTFSIMHETRQYVVLPHDISGVPPKPVSMDDFKIESTGKTEKIHGYTCKQIKIREKNGMISEWMIAPSALDLKTFNKELHGFNVLNSWGCRFVLRNIPEIKSCDNLQLCEWKQRKSRDPYLKFLLGIRRLKWVEERIDLTQSSRRHR